MQPPRHPFNEDEELGIVAVVDDDDDDDDDDEGKLTIDTGRPPTTPITITLAVYILSSCDMAMMD